MDKLSRSYGGKLPGENNVSKQQKKGSRGIRGLPDSDNFLALYLQFFKTASNTSGAGLDSVPSSAEIISSTKSAKSAISRNYSNSSRLADWATATLSPASYHCPNVAPADFEPENLNIKR